MKGDNSKWATYHALSNAAALLEAQLEGGGISDLDFDFPFEIYDREARKVVKMLYAKAEKYLQEHNLK